MKSGKWVEWTVKSGVPPAACSVKRGGWERRGESGEKRGGEWRASGVAESGPDTSSTLAFRGKQLTQNTSRAFPMRDTSGHACTQPFQWMQHFQCDRHFGTRTRKSLKAASPMGHTSPNMTLTHLQSSFFNGRHVSRRNARQTRQARSRCICALERNSNPTRTTTRRRRHDEAMRDTRTQVQSL